MSTHPPLFNPSQAVERIREIIVGRHLERLEERIERYPERASIDERFNRIAAAARALAQSASPITPDGETSFSQ